jgi:hypothetical protein
MPVINVFFFCKLTTNVNGDTISNMTVGGVSIVLYFVVSTGFGTLKITTA